MSELPNRYCCSLCFSWGQMCATYYGRMKRDSTRGEITMCGKDCACGGRRKKKISEDSGKTIDWDKPIQCRTRAGRILPLKYVGWHLGGTIVDFGNPTTGTSSLHYAEKVTFGTIENVPESKPEKWINVYWNSISQTVNRGIICTSEAAAENKIRRYARHNYLGTFKIEE